MKYLYHTIKWSTILAIVLSVWIVAAWLKADLKPDLIQPIPTHRVVEIVAQKPTSGQEWAFQECVKVRFLQDKQKSTSRGQTHESEGAPSSRQGAGPGGEPGTPSTDHPTPPSGSQSQGQGTLPLGKYLVPSGGRDPLWVTPELDPVSGETKLQVEPAGGYARFGGERAVGGSFEIWSSSNKRVELFLTQGLGRVGRVEFSATATTAFEVNDLASGVSVGARLSMWVPF